MTYLHTAHPCLPTFWGNPWTADLNDLLIGRDVEHLLSRRARRLLRLQGFHTARALSLGVHTGAFDAYPAWLVEEIEAFFNRLRPLFDQVNERERIASVERRARLYRLDWSQTAIGRPLSPQELARLADVASDDLPCAWPAKAPVVRLGAFTARDVSLLDCGTVLACSGMGPARLIDLRRAINRALVEDVTPEWVRRRRPDDAARFTLAGHTLSPLEIAVLQRYSILSLGLSRRITNALADAGVLTWLDVAAISAHEIVRLPNCGHRTLANVRRAIGDGFARLGLVLTESERNSGGRRIAAPASPGQSRMPAPMAHVPDGASCSSAALKAATTYLSSAITRKPGVH